MRAVSWRERLYENYVSGGQGGGGASQHFAPQSPFYRKIISAHLPADKSIRVLDLGCGAGGILYNLKKMGYNNITGVDLSKEMVELAHQSGVKEAQVGNIVDFLAETKDGSIDVIFAMDVLEHLTREELFNVCDEIARVLSDKGKVIAHVPNAAGIFGSKIRYGDITHELAFTATSIRQTLVATGFSSVSCYEDVPVSHGLKSAIRAVIWRIGTFPFRVIHAAETGTFSCILSQNVLAVGSK